MKKKSVKSVKRKNKFYCELCNYTASQKSHFNKHLSTKKHKRMTGKNVENTVKKVKEADKTDLIKLIGIKKTNKIFE